MQDKDPKPPLPSPQQMFGHLLRMVALFYALSMVMSFFIEGWEMMFFQIYMFWGISTIDKGFRRLGTSLVLAAQTTNQVAKMLVMAMFWPLTDRLLAERYAASNPGTSSPRDQ